MYPNLCCRSCRDDGIGIHRCLKSIRPKGHAGSNPAPGTQNSSAVALPLQPGGNVSAMREDETMYPQETDAAIHLSAIGVLDQENARICGVSVAAILHRRAGRRRVASAEVSRACTRCHERHLHEPAYAYLLGHACSRSTGPNASTSGKSSWNDGRTPSPDNTRVNLQEGCSIPTAGAASNGSGEGWPVAIAGTSIRAINSEPSPGTFSGCAVRR